ncbi:MAG: hypothetical protein NTV70_08970 [Acidobacteria bacterium]|nr:hypothetical protein [Acidobacteriota bacterium]
MRFLICFLLGAAMWAQEASPYVFGFLRVNPNRKQIPAAESEAIQEKHMAHLNQMAQSGALIGAGPLMASPDLRGVLIFKGVTLAEAVKMSSNDPVVTNQRLKVDLADWMGTPGIGDALAAQLKADPKAKYAMTKHALVVYWKTDRTPADLTAPAAAPTLQAHMAFTKRLDQEGKFAAEEPMAKAGWVRTQAFEWFVAEGVMPEKK